MTDAAVFKGTIGALRTIGGRKVIAVTVEVPIEHQSVVAKIAEHGAWVAVARLAEGDAPATPEKPKRSWNELSVGEQAGIRCGEPRYWKFLEPHAARLHRVKTFQIESADAAAAALRDLLGVKSRKDISPSLWRAFDADYLHWLRT